MRRGGKSRLRSGAGQAASRRRLRLPGWRFWLLLLLGLSAYVAFLIAGLPSAVAWEFAKRYVDIPQQVEVGSLQGTIWNGRVLGLGTAEVQAEQVSWSVQPTALLRGSLVVEIEGTMVDGFAEGRAELDRGGLTVLDLNGRLPASPWGALAAEFGGEEVALEGTFSFAIDQLELDYSGDIHRADGRLAWHDAAITVDQHARLGGITTTLVTDADGRLTGELGDTGGELVLSGNWWLDLASGSYEVDAIVDTREEAADILTRSLELAGPRQDDGVHIGLEGSL
ncbi:type II secretion system protein N [Halorhodospira halochloris]|uniref:type II secretion system protein N n=1 Tax=Halorhodospira halochloris TaxID=1052 RepID=UPI001EE92736|nr:type II secretion system protein N [Halorhodospira halochloris]MCG5529264.1 type II secretion system protein N [Halorhodospira halochloris]MCG5547238.1 type II secretion system protein N [Halorhodospira halochloris]